MTPRATFYWRWYERRIMREGTPRYRRHRNRVSTAETIFREIVRRELRG